MLTMIFACDLDNAIGKNGDLPWRQSTDLQHFKQITTGGTIVMGRKTWDSLPGMLPNRRHLVMSRNNLDAVETITFDGVLKLSETDEIFIIGGGEIYSLFLPHVDKIHRTIIHCKVNNADTYAPMIDYEEFTIKNSKFVEKSARDDHDMTFELLVRID